jgi:hypothetical protein
VSFMRKRERALISLCIVLTAVASCRSEDSSAPTNNSTTDPVVSSKPPYQTREPERYRATRTITSFAANGGTLVTTSSTTRDGEMRRQEMEFVSKQVVSLDLPQGRFILLPEEKVYAEFTGQTLPAPGDDYETGGSSVDGRLHAESVQTSYQKLGPETTAGRNATKYRIVVNGLEAANVSPSETLVWIDEALGLIIRSETKSSDGSHSTMVLSEISLDVEPSVFQLPADYQKLPLIEFMTRLSGVK